MNIVASITITQQTQNNITQILFLTTKFNNTQEAQQQVKQTQLPHNSLLVMYTLYSHNNQQ